jgi:PAS domain S-box-containing protein
LKKSNQTYFFLFLIFTLCAVFAFYLNGLITKRKEDQQQLKKEVIHQRTVDQFETSIENFAAFVAGLSAYIHSQPSIPTAQELQAFTNNSLEKIQFNDSIVISYLDSTHAFIFSFDRNTINQHNLVGTNVASIRNQEEIDFLNMVMQDDVLHLNKPINLVEGWLGIPLLFSINKNGESIGYLAPIVNFSTIINRVYDNIDTEEFYFKFTADGIEFDRGAIYDGSKIYNKYSDPEYFRKHELNDSLLTTDLKLYGYHFTIGTAFKNPGVITIYQTVLVYGFLLLISIFLSYLGAQYIKNGKVNEFLTSSKELISSQNLELIEAKEKYTELLTNVGDGVFELDSEGKCVYINPKMLEMLNRTPDQVMESSIWDFIHPDDVIAMQHYYGEKFKMKASSCLYEYRLDPLDKDPIWIQQSTTMQYEGKKMMKLQSVARDISELKKLREELLEKESLFRLVSENSSDLIAIHELDGTYKFVSPASKDLIGYTPHELEGRNPYEFIHPNDVERLKNGAHSATIQGESIQLVEYRMRKKTGLYIWMESYTRPIIDDNGEISSFQTSSRNITEKKVEREQLEKAKILAEEASSEKDHFLSMMSHEIRTPLNGIIGTTHLLLSNDPHESQLSHLHILRQSSDNLRAIVNDILDFSKIEEGKIEIDKSVFDLRYLVRGIYENYHQQASEKGVVVTCEVDKKISQYYIGDSVRISQVLHNLMSNAVKFTDEGAISISLSISNQHDEFDEILFIVQDNGIGIPKDRQDSIFEVFVQADKSTTRKYGGSGLGLSITKRLLEFMDSEIILNSSPGTGSKFEFKLALSRASKELTIENYNGANHPLTPLAGTVLIVEDNAFNMNIARDFLHQWGCDTIEATNGKLALEALESEKIDLVLMDLQMPVMDGYETIEIIRSKKSHYYQQLPVVALTAAALGDIKMKVFQSGMDDFITKPFHPSEFHSTISFFLKKRTSSVIDKNIIHHITRKLSSALQDESVANKYVKIFIETMTEESGFLKHALDNKLMNEIKEYSHKNKSSLKMVGLDSLALDAEELEEMIDRKRPVRIILERTKVHLNDILDLLNKLKVT